MKIALLLLLSSFASGCAFTPVAETHYKTGSELITNEDGNFEYVTYFTPEDFEKLTTDERRRLNARIGAEMSFSLKPRKKKPLPQSTDESPPEN